MTQEAIITLNIKQLQSKLTSGHISLDEVIDAYSSRIKSHDKKIQAFINHIPKEDLLKKTKKLPKGKLYGVPFSLKEAYMTEEVITSASSKVLHNFVAPYNATVYQRIIDEGGILLGKTNADAWGHGSSTENSDFFTTKNPWNTDFVPGGSSGGSGAAVASRMSLFDLGEDTGGSSRLPANFCGLVALKPTYGLISRYGVIELASSLDTVAPITRSIEDLAIILEVIVGKDIKDATSVDFQPPTYTKEMLSTPKETITLGIPAEYMDPAVLDKEVLKDLNTTIDRFKSLGYRFQPISLPHSKYAIAVYYVIMTSETSSNLGRYDGIRYGNDRSAFGAEAKRRIMLGTYCLSSGFADEYYHKAAKVRRLIKEDFDKAFDKVDAIFAPVSPTPAFKIGNKSTNPLQMYLSDILTVPVNLAGIPSLAMPSGGFTGKDNIPLGFQLIGKRFSEASLLQIGYSYEKLVGGFKLPS